MTADDVAERVRAELEAFHYVELTREEAGTLGIPWSAEKVAGEIELLRRALVAPVLTEVVDMDTFSPGKRIAEWWLVAEAPGQKLLFYDPYFDEFALAIGDPLHRPESICVRGDLCSTFMAR